MATKFSKAEIKTQFNRANQSGWLPFFIRAASSVTIGHFDAADLLAIASRESNLDPKWLTKAGDGGNGFGLMQADRRSFPEFTKGDGWKKAETGILFGAKVLMSKWIDYESNIGKTLTVKSSKGGSYKYKSEKADGADAQKIVISSYNCGRWAQYAYANNQDIDKYSTGRDYAADVMARAAVFRELLKSTSAIPVNKFIDLPNAEGIAPEDNADLDQQRNLEEEFPFANEIAAQKVAQTNVVEVAQVVPAKDVKEHSLPEKIEETAGKVKAWYAALPTSIVMAIAAFWERISSGETNLVFWLVGILGVIAVGYFVGIFIVKRARERDAKDIQIRELDLKKQREIHSHELQILTLKAAADPNMNTVRIAPMPIENSDLKI